MRHLPALIAACALGAVAAWLWAGAEGAAPGAPAVAVLTFAVAAFSGPVR